jgi:hypothetical protein
MPKAAGQRFIASSDFLWLADIARILREQFGPRAAKVPTKAAPDVLIRFAAFFNDECACRNDRSANWLTSQSAANRSLKRDSLLTGKRTGNFVKIGPFGKKPPVRT